MSESKRPIGRQGKARFRQQALILVGLFALAAAVRLPGLVSRAVWYDEAITLLTTSGHARPAWPTTTPEPVDSYRGQLTGVANWGLIAEQHRQTRAHPPLYSWCLALWKRCFGTSLEAAKAFSLLVSSASVCVLFLLLKAGRLPIPIIPSVVFALTGLGVYFGHTVRAYAFALFLIVLSAYCAYVSTRWANRHTGRAVGWALAGGFFCGASMLANYLAYWPVLAIGLWYLIQTWRRTRWLPMVMALGAAPLGLLSLSFVLGHLTSRAAQFAGTIGLFDQIRLLLWMNLSTFYISMLPSKVVDYAVWAFVGLLLLLSLWRVVKQWPGLGRQKDLLWLMLALGLAPTVGIVILNIASSKNLHFLRYVGYGLPSLAVFVTYGLTSWLAEKPRLAGGLLVALVALQLTGINWGQEMTRGYVSSSTRSMARTLEALPTPVVTVIGMGWGRGHPGAVIYEMNPKSGFIVLKPDADLDAMQMALTPYATVCISSSVDERTRDIEDGLRDHLWATGEYALMQNPHLAAVCLFRDMPASR